MVTFIHPEDSAKETIFHHICFFCVQRGSLHFWQRQNWRDVLNGVPICQKTPKISNLLFADDSLLFCQATHSEVEVIIEILQTYTGALGHSINLEKSLVYFSSNTQGRQKEEIMAALGMKEVERFESYLSLPTLIGHAKYQTFSYLKDRVWKKL